MSVIRATFNAYKSLIFQDIKGFKKLNDLQNSSYNIGYRFLSSNSIPLNITKDDKREFMAVFPDIVRDLSNFEVPEINLLISKILQYNVSGGKKIRGLTSVFSYRLLASPGELTEDNIRLSQILGWCVEMLQAYLIICDDITDCSEMRRGRLCWYKQPDVGLRAISDALMVEGSIYKILNKHFSEKVYYLPILELFLDSSLRTICGQTLDCNTNMILPFSKRYTMDRYMSIVKLKTSYYTFHLPVAVAMYQAGINDPELHRQAKSVLMELGRYFQVQDDYIDVFGDSKETGKIGTDIQDGKCTWLAVVAMHKATGKERALFEDCYGNNDPEKVALIKDMFVKIGLPALYSAFEEETYNMIFTQIQQLSKGLPHDLFLALLNNTHKRSK